MAFRYFHSSNRHTTLDAVGIDLPNLLAVLGEAIRAFARTSVMSSTAGPWKDPWRMGHRRAERNGANDPHS